MIKRRGKVLEQVLKTYASSQPLHATLPSVSDIVGLPAFKAVVEDTPPEEEVSESHFQQAMVDFPQTVAEWRHSKNEALLAMINDHPKTQTTTTSIILEQAGTFFLCGKCCNRISYPRILVHRCISVANPWSFGDPDDFFRSFPCEPLDHKDSFIQYDHLTSRIARLILDDCQFDAETLTTTSLSEMTSKGLRFECHLCKSRKDGRLVMKWPIVVSVSCLLSFHLHSLILPSIPRSSML